MNRPRITTKSFEDPRWRKKRAEILERDGWRCQSDGNHAGDLNVHHRNYTTAEPWHELNENLITVCEKHHQGEHDQLGASDRDVAAKLMESNWMVKHRKLLAQCIEERAVTPEEIYQFLITKLNERKRL
jgi:5-methylcytosine-specific restriction endonuclease McrA